jgi:hypothetical protein
MHVTLKNLGLLSILGSVSLSAQAALPVGISGAWFKPGQSGHGVSIEILAPDRALLFWYVYDQNGVPMPLYVDGVVRGREIRGTAYNPSGMRFGSFDPAEHTLPVWGEVSMTFEDCSSARLEWQADSAVFGSGELPFTRLAELDGSACTLVPRGSVQAQTYAMSTTMTFDPSPTVFRATGYAALDSDGTVWAVETAGGGLASLDLILGPTNVGLPLHALIGKPLRGAADLDQLRLRAGNNSWANSPGREVIQPTIDESVRDDDGSLRLEFIVPYESSNQFLLTPSPLGLVSPVSVERISGSYVQKLKGQFINTDATVDLAADGSACLKILFNPTPLRCDLDGKVWIVDGDEGFFDIELRDRRDLAADVYRGRGWLQNSADGERLVIVASNGDHVMGVVAR